MDDPEVVIRFEVGERDFSLILNVLTGLEDFTVSELIVSVILCGDKAAAVRTRPLLSRLRKHGAIPPFPTMSSYLAQGLHLS
jgi:hypothetical protein